MKLAWDGKQRIEPVKGGYQRERSADLYHTARWTRMSKAWKASHPLCEECKRNGVIKAAEVTDHIIPWPVCGVEGFFNRDNFQSLCSDCNHAKGQRDKAVISQWRREKAQRGEGVSNL